MITTISQLIALVESNNNPSAARHEPAYVVTPSWVAKLSAANPGWSQDTYKTFASTSFGLYQIMGDWIYATGYRGTLMNFWSNTTIQDAAFINVLDIKGIDYTLDEVINDQAKRENFARHYNGPGNIQAYSQRILDVFARNK